MTVAGVYRKLSAPVQGLVESLGFREPTPPQERAIPNILAGRNVLVVAPTGSGKTEAALFPVLDRLANTERRGIRCLYVTPLRALNRDMERRLVAMAAGLGLTAQVRHGDTPTKDRRKQSTKPPDVLITTPETLQAILPGKAMRNHLRHVRFVVVDEVHQIARDRRGVQLTVGLERLEEIAPGFQRIGLSATVGEPEAMARFLGGGAPVEVVRVSPVKRMKFDLTEDEVKNLTRARQTADLVAVYGRKAVVAQAVYGIGPQTASKILARMHDDETAFYADLFDAKLRYITTRPYWDRAAARPSW